MKPPKATHAYLAKRHEESGAQSIAEKTMLPRSSNNVGSGSPVRRRRKAQHTHKPEVEIPPSPHSRSENVSSDEAVRSGSDLETHELTITPGSHSIDDSHNRLDAVRDTPSLQSAKVLAAEKTNKRQASRGQVTALGRQASKGKSARQNTSRRKDREDVEKRVKSLTSDEEPPL